MQTIAINHKQNVESTLNFNHRSGVAYSTNPQKHFHLATWWRYNGPLASQLWNRRSENYKYFFLGSRRISPNRPRPFASTHTHTHTHTAPLHTGVIFFFESVLRVNADRHAGRQTESDTREKERARERAKERGTNTT